MATDATTERAKAPVHLWIVGALALIWNAFGAYDYLMTRMRNEEYFRSMMPGVEPDAILAWVDAFPVWAAFGWGLGVWGGLVGAILLLLRNRWAVSAFAASLIGAIVGLGYQLLAAPPLAGMDPSTARIMPVVIILVALGLVLYARAMRARGVLR